MKLICILATWFLYWTQIIDSRKYRLILDDEVYPYSIDKGMPSLAEYFSIEHLIFELIDDDTVTIGGYAVCIKEINPKLPVQFDLRTQYREQSSWHESPVRLLLLNACSEAVNPSRPAYNITKLWTNCPPRKGEKFLVETQIINIQIAVPPSFPVGKWRWYILLSQGLLGSVGKFGFMMQTEFVEVV